MSDLREFLGEGGKKLPSSFPPNIKMPDKAIDFSAWLEDSYKVNGNPGNLKYSQG
jgi:hypothetical protein